MRRGRWDPVISDEVAPPLHPRVVANENNASDTHGLEIGDSVLMIAPSRDETSSPAITFHAGGCLWGLGCGSGAGGLVNIPAGVLLINATLAASGRLVGSVGVNARPGYASMVLLKPNGS